MLIFAIDDEPKMLKLLHKSIERAAPKAEIMNFPLGTKALKAIEDQKLKPNVVFSDIRMPKLDGLALAVKIKKASPNTKIIFVTGYSEYAVEAFGIRANGYLMKPVKPEDIRKEIDYVVPAITEPSGKLQVQCFGKFEVFCGGAPVQFKRLQTKELFAFLIDQKGTFCTSEEIALAIWEDEIDKKVLSHRLRNLVSDLRSTLDAINQKDVIIRTNRTIAVNRSMVDCDYYRMLEGDMNAVNTFAGEYMRQYSWAKITEGDLYFKLQRD